VRYGRDRGRYCIENCAAASSLVKLVTRPCHCGDLYCNLKHLRGSRRSNDLCMCLSRIEIFVVKCASRSYRCRAKRFVIAGGLDLPPLCSRRGLDPNCRAIVDDTEYIFDWQAVSQLRPNLYHVSLPLSSDLRLLLVSNN
jgi:hypothetical protein